MEVKTKRFDLRIYDDYVDIEVKFNGTVWYYMEEYLTDDLMDLVNDYTDGNITLLDFVYNFFSDVKFEDEDEEQEAHEFSLEEWRYIIG